jgi:hypothetical protein
VAEFPALGLRPYREALFDWLKVAHNTDGTPKDPSYKLASSLSTGAITVTVDRSVESPIIVGSILLLSAYTSRAELKAVTGIAGNTVTVTATKTAHTAGDKVIAVTKDGITAQMYGCLGDGTDEWSKLQRLLTEAIVLGLSVEGFNATFYTQQPLLLPTSGRINNIAFQSRTGFAPVQAAGGMVMLSAEQGRAFTASAATDTFTYAAGHGLSDWDQTNHSMIVFNNPYGEALPGGVTSGQVYYVNTVPNGNDLTVSATSGGAILNITSDGAGTGFGSVYQPARIFSESLRLNLTIADLNGLKFNLQQPSWTRNLRVEMDAAASVPEGAVGIDLTGQLSYHDNIEVNTYTNCTGMVIAGTGMVVRGFNCNGILIGDKGLRITGDSHTVLHPWTEHCGAAGIEISGIARGITIGGTWIVAIPNSTAPALLVSATTTSYDLGLIHCSNGSNLLVSDTARGLTIRAWDGSLGNDSDQGLVFGGLRQQYGTGAAPVLRDRVFISRNSNYTARRIDETIYMDVTGVTRTVTLPTAAGWPGLRHTIGNWVGANSVIIDPDGSETIDGAATVTLTPGQAVTIISNGTNWVTLAAIS